MHAFPLVAQPRARLADVQYSIASVLSGTASKVHESDRSPLQGRRERTLPEPTRRSLRAIDRRAGAGRVRPQAPPVLCMLSPWWPTPVLVFAAVQHSIASVLEGRCMRPVGIAPVLEWDA